MCDEHKSSIAWELDEEDRPTWWIRDANSGECFYADSDKEVPPEQHWFDQHGEPAEVQVRPAKKAQSRPASVKDCEHATEKEKGNSETGPSSEQQASVSERGDSEPVQLEVEENTTSEEPKARRQLERKHGFIQQVLWRKA